MIWPSCCLARENSANRLRRWLMASPHRVVKRMRVGKGLQLAYIDKITGIEYPSRAAFRTAVRLRNADLLVNFERHVADKTLGQEAWERLPGETDLAYDRFRIYLLMGVAKDGRRTVSRSVTTVAKQVGVSFTVLRKVAEKYHWTIRAASYDKEVDRQLDEEFREARRTSARRQARLGEKLQRAAG